MHLIFSVFLCAYMFLFRYTEYILFFSKVLAKKDYPLPTLTFSQILVTSSILHPLPMISQWSQSISS